MNHGIKVELQNDCFSTADDATVACLASVQSGETQCRYDLSSLHLYDLSSLLPRNLTVVALEVHSYVVLILCLCLLRIRLG